MLVFVHVANSTGNPVSSVTYGGVTLTRVSGGAAIDSAGEAGRTDLFFAGSGLASGNQTITVNRANTTDIMYASAATVTAATNTNVTGIVLLEGDGALTVQSVTDGGAPTNSLRYAAAYSGLASPPPAGTGSTLLNSIDFGNYGIASVVETTAGTGARNVGFNNATTDDRAAVHVAVRELWNRTDTETVGAFTLTGQPADLRHNPKIAGDLGKFFLPERNVIKQSEQFDDINNWKVVRANALANNTAAPDGSITAEFIRETATTGTHVLASEPNNAIPAVVGPASYTFSCHLKANGRNATLRVDGGGGGGSGASGEVLFDLATGGTTTLAAGTITASGATDVGNGWYRCWISFTTTQAGTCRADTYLYSTSTSYTGDGTSGIYAWGAQLEQSASLTEYDPAGLGSVTPITFKYNRVLAGGTGAYSFAGSPADLRIGHAIAGNVGKFFLPEKNFIRYSEQFDNAYWNKNGIGAALAPAVTANNTAAPDGTLTADRIVFDTNGSTTVNDRSDLEAGVSTSSVIGKAYIFSVWLKTTDGSSVTIQFSHAGVAANYPTVTGTWQRFTSLSNTAGDTARRPRLSLRVGTPASAYASLHVWGFQWEEGTSITDYDPTSPAGATDATLRQAYRLDGGVGAFTFTGRAADTLHNARIDGGTGAFSLIGNDATLTKATFKAITAETGAYTLTGNTATVRRGYALAAVTGTFTAAGQPATLRHNPRIEASTGAFALSGGAPTLLRGRYLSGGPGTFIETGQPATFRRTWAVQAATGAFSFTGNPASLTELGAYEIAATVGAFTLSGQPASLAQSQTMPVAAGSYSFTGQPATLRQNQALAAVTGSFAAAGQPAALTQGYLLEAGTGAFSFTGQPATLAKQSAKQLTADAGVFTLAGRPATLTVGRRFAAERGTYSLTGQTALLQRGLSITADVGAFALIGKPSTFRADRLVNVDNASYVLTGQSVNLSDTDLINAGVGTFALSGQAITLTKTRRRNVLIF